jgi:AsmA protein
VPRLTLAALGMTARLTNLSGTKIIDAPSFAGKLEVAPFDAKAALARLGTKVETADGAALTRVGVNTAFTASTQNVELKDFALSLDGTRIAGSLAIRNLDKPAYRFDLAAGDLDLDRYMPPAPAERKAAQGGATQAAPQPVVIPFTLLRDLDVDGKLRIEKLKASGLRSTDVATRLRAQGGVIELKPSTARLYGGSYQGAIGIDARG